MDEMNEGEKEFMEWLNQHSIPFWYIKQDISTFSKAIRALGTKRPDFMLLIPNMGALLVDVKEKHILEKHGEFPIDKEETLKYSRLERNSNLKVWYAISHKNFGFKTWYWIPTSKVIEIGKEKEYKSPLDKNPYYSIPVEEFIQIPSNKSIDTLFTLEP